MSTQPQAGLFPAAAQWRELAAAWRERNANPVAHYFTLARRRRRAALPWWRRRIPLLAGLLAATAAGYSLLQGGAFFSAAGGWPRLAQASMIAACVAAGAWLVQALFDAVVSAAGLLSLPGKRKLDLQADPALLAVRATAAELLLGFALPLWRTLVWPLLLAASLSTMASITFAFLDQPQLRPAGRSAPPPTLLVAAGLAPQAMAARAAIAGGDPLAVADAVLPFWLQALLLSPLTMSGIAFCGLLASAALILLFMCAGRRWPMDVHSGVLATLFAIGTLVFGAVTQGLTQGVREAYAASEPTTAIIGGQIEPLVYLLWLAGLLLSVMSLLHFLRGRGGGLWLGYSLPLLFLGSLALLVYCTSQGMRRMYLAHVMLDAFFAWSMFAPISAIAAPYPACLGTGFAHLVAHPQWHHFRWPLLLVAQGLLAAALLRAALDSIAWARAAEAE